MATTNPQSCARCGHSYCRTDLYLWTPRQRHCLPGETPAPLWLSEVTCRLCAGCARLVRIAPDTYLLTRLAEIGTAAAG